MPYKNPNSRKAKESLRRARRKHYAKNKEDYKARAREEKAKTRKWFDKIRSVPCTDCNKEYPPCAMDLDHVRGKKVKNLSAMITAGAGWDKLIAEVEKCEVVCAVCHRIRHARASGRHRVSKT